MGEKEIKVPRIIFYGRKSINWDDVEKYLERFRGDSFITKQWGDVIKFSRSSIEEYTSSLYTRRLKGTLAKVKANIVQIIPELIENADNKRWVPNNNSKHRYDASKGWYRFDSVFFMPVSINEMEIVWKKYICTIIVRANDTGLYLYDIINIKKRSE